MANLKNVIYLSNEDYETLVSTGTVTIDGTTLTYDENNVYITPESLASTTEDGLMSASDKVKLNSLEAISSADWEIVADTLTITFSETNLQGKNYLKVYDGLDTSGTLLYTSSGSSAATSPLQVNISSGSFYIDISLNEDYRLYISQVTPSAGISNLNYSAGDSGYIKGDISDNSTLFVEIDYND